MGTKIFKKAVILALIPFLIISCGGGGGGGDGETPQIETQSVEISGKVTENGSTVNSIFSITVNVIDKNGKTVSTKTTSTALNQNNTQINGSYSVKIGLISGGKVVVTAEAPGYTKATKTVSYTSGSSLTINLDVKPLATQTVNLDKGIVINSAGKEYVRVAFFKDKKTGKLTALSGIKALNADSSDKVIDLAIPLNKLQSGTEQLNISYRSYEPSNPSDYQDFPGTETTDGYQLVSFGFDYLEITDQEGQNPFVNSQGISAQLVSGEYYRILREVDCKQINNLKNSGVLVDEDQNKEGIQFTFYAYDFDQGGWIKAGEGTFVENNSIDFMNSEWDTIISSGCDPNSTSTDNNDNEAGCDEYGIIRDINNICDGSDIDYVVISVTNPSLEWKNLDYIIPGGSEISCNINVVDDDNNPISGAYVTATANCMAYIDGMTDSNGNLTLSTIGYSNPCTADLEAWYMMKKGSAQADFNGNCNVTITITNPYKCKVEGKVVDENNNPVEGLIVWTSTMDFNSSNLSATQMEYDLPVGVTDSNGNFSVKTECNKDGYLYAKFKFKRYNVNGKKDYDENSDNGSTVNVGTIQITNEPPYGYLYVPTDPTLNEPVLIELCANDFEGDYPIKYKIEVKKGSSVDKTFTGEINSTDFCVTHSYTPTTEDVYAVTGELEDSKGNKRSTLNDLIGKISQDHYLVGDISADLYKFNFSYGNQTYDYVLLWMWGDFDDSDPSHSITSSATYECYDSSDNLIRSGNATGDDFIEIYDYNTDLTDAAYCSITVTAEDGTTTISHTKKVDLIEK